MRGADADRDRRVPPPGSGSDRFPAWEAPPSIPSGIPGSYEDRIRLALRIVVHLSRIRSPGEDGVASPELTQQGIAAALSVTQGAVSKVLRRLVAAQIARADRYHVRGQNRRVRVYTLTPRGLGLAHEIQGRFPLPERPAELGFLPPRGTPTSP